MKNGSTIVGVIAFPGRYIAEPYWPERAAAIDIDKQSGVSRARSESARVKALDAHLKKIGMSAEEFYRLQQKAERAFYTAADITNVYGHSHYHAADEIVIPSDRILACLVQGCDQAPSAVRIAKPEQLRTVLTVDPIYTGKTGPDGHWVRAVVPKKDGKPISNQRGTRSSAYIEQFSAPFTVHFSEAQVTPKRLKDFIEWTGREIGIGASRKMNNGRFSVNWQ